MKGIVILVALAATYPLGRLCRRWPRGPEIATTLLGALPFLFDIHDYMAINLVSNETYRGDARGFEFTAVDVVAATLWFCLPPGPGIRFPYKRVGLTYLAVALFSVTAAIQPTFALFSVWKIVRGLFVLVVAARACASPPLARALTNGLGLGVIASGLKVVEQRYHLGIHQCYAYFPHQNSLGMAVNLVVPIALAVLLAGQGGRIAIATVLSGAVAVLLTLSRGSLAMMGLAVTLTFAGSAMRGVTRRKVWVIGTTLVVGLALFAYAAKTIFERFETAPVSSAESRDLFVDAAKAMLDDHPLGIGINQYSWTLDHGGYADRFHLEPIDRGGIAHHIYWLTAAEMGYAGIVSYLFVLAVPWWLAVRGYWHLRGDIRGDVLLGCAVGLTVMYLQGTAEWIARQTEMTYLFWSIAGLVFGLRSMGKREGTQGI